MQLNDKRRKSSNIERYKYIGKYSVSIMRVYSNLADFSCQQYKIAPNDQLHTEKIISFACG